MFYQEEAIERKYDKIDSKVIKFKIWHDDC